MPSKLLTKEQAKHIGKSGSSPVFLTKEQLLKVTPAWLDVMIKMATMPIAKEVCMRLAARSAVPGATDNALSA